MNLFYIQPYFIMNNKKEYFPGYNTAINLWVLHDPNIKCTTVIPFYFCLSMCIQKWNGNWRKEDLLINGGVEFGYLYRED